MRLYQSATGGPGVITKAEIVHGVKDAPYKGGFERIYRKDPTTHHAWRAKRCLSWMRRVEPFASLPGDQLRQHADAISKREDADELIYWLSEKAYRSKHRPMVEYRGEGSPSHKLTNEKVIAMRVMRTTLKLSYYKLAAAFGCSQPNALAICQGDSWKHLPGAEYNEDREWGRRFRKETGMEPRQARR